MHPDLEEGSVVRIKSTAERGFVVSAVLDWCSIRTRTGIENRAHDEVDYLGTPGRDCPYLSDYDF